MSLFLTDEELTELTGYRVKPKRLEALRDMRIPHTVNARGRIVVRRDYNVNRERADEFIPGEVS